MPDPAGPILWAISFLLLKHAVADYYLQTPYQYRNKGTYGHLGGLLHAGLHVLFTLPVFLIIAPISLLAGALIVAGEFVVHYHVDWIKEQFVKRNRLTSENATYWQAMGTDQLAHGLTYVLIVAILAGALN